MSVQRMPSSAPETRLGDVIGGRYRVLSVLGRGGMGVLYTAEHQLTHRRVALKLLLPDREDLPELHQRFLLEARTAASVRHPNVVDVLDMGVHEDGSPFLVMELLEGTSLDRALTVQRRLEPERALAVALPILGALATLHDAGIVHRDVKPSNIFLAAGLRGEVEPKLLDFGLARTMSDLRLTRSGMVLGTPLYMSPEQAAGEAVSFQTDIWSLGIVLFECLSGELPFTSRDSGAIAAQVLAGRVRGLASVLPELPAPLAHAVDRALRRDVNLRYRDMREFARGLIAAAVSCGITLPDNPDPVGLPDYRAWRGQATVPSTVAAAKPAASLPPVDESPAAVSAITDSSRAPTKKSRSTMVAVLSAAIVLAVCAAWAWSWAKQAPSSSETARHVEPPAKLEASTRPAVTPSAPPVEEPAAAQAPEPSTPPEATQPSPPMADDKPSQPAPKPRPAHKGRSKDATKAAQTTTPAPAPAPVAPAPKPSTPDALGIEGEWK